jgi:hypothetical protein
MTGELKQRLPYDMSAPSDIPTFVKFCVQSIDFQTQVCETQISATALRATLQILQTDGLCRLNLLRIVRGQGHRRNMQPVDRWKEILDVMPSRPEWLVYLNVVSSIFKLKMAKNSGSARDLYSFVCVLLRVAVTSQTADDNGRHVIPKATVTNFQNFLSQIRF